MLKVSLKGALTGCLMLATAASLPLGQAMAKDLTIQVWAGGSNVADAYRVDAITMAADILERESAIRGEELNIINS